MKKYYWLDIIKFALTLMIAVFHLWADYGVNARGGFIAVEFFFLLSGFFLIKQHEEIPVVYSPAQYTWTRIKKIYPHYIFSFIIMFLVTNRLSGSTWRAGEKNLLTSIPEIFMLSGTILSDKKTYIYNSQTWYLSMLIIVGYLLWALLKRHKSFVLTMAPVAALWIYAYMAYTLKTTNNWRTHVFEVLNYAALRAIAGMLLGITIYHASKKLSDYLSNDSKTRHPDACLIGGTAIIIIAIAASYRWFHQASFVYIACFAVGAMLLVVGEEAPPRIAIITSASIPTLGFPAGEHLLCDIFKPLPYYACYAEDGIS